MGVVTLDSSCPHCLREKATLVAVAEQRQSTPSRCATIFMCKSCEELTTVILEVMDQRTPMGSAKFYTKNIVIYKDPILSMQIGYPFIKMYPSEQSHNAPDHSPQRCAKFFIEAKENLQRGNNETSVMLCRKVIDIATREILGEDSKKEQLSQRISMLHGKGKITEQMKDWAHIVRIDSNGAVHSDEEFTKAEAEEMIGFTEVFLIYSFTLPEMVKAKQHKPEE
ncbi:DUF4145 domain-containing protein [Serratia marcescens]|nr:DUF4145 domain-containing protein [Serratia marcescens]MBN5194657.1 DUF4145 domain-containing protein [Serratia marcescens]